jgi:hypothetical protein
MDPEDFNNRVREAVRRMHALYPEQQQLAQQWLDSLQAQHDFDDRVREAVRRMHALPPEQQQLAQQWLDGLQAQHDFDDRVQPFVQEMNQLPPEQQQLTQQWPDGLQVQAPQAQPGNHQGPVTAVARLRSSPDGSGNHLIADNGSQPLPTTSTASTGKGTSQNSSTRGR